MLSVSVAMFFEAPYVLDVGVLAPYFAERSDAKKYVDEGLRGRAKGCMCEIIVAEFYSYAKVFGWSIALVKHSLLRNSPTMIVDPDEGLAIEAAKLELKYYRVLSLADCCLIAPAKNVEEVPTIVLEV